MNPTTVLSEFVSQLGANSGLPGLGLDDSGHAAIRFDGAVNIHMQARATDVVLYAVLGTLTSEKTAALFLRANFLWQHTGGATFSLAPSGHVVLCIKVEVEGLNFEGFQARLVAFAQSCEEWTAQLEAQASDSAEAVTMAADADVDIPHFAIPI